MQCVEMNVRKDELPMREVEPEKKDKAHLTSRSPDNSEQKLLRLLPGVGRVPEVPVRGGLQVLGLLQVKLAD